MRLQISKSKNSSSLYVIKTIYINGKEKTKIVEKLGTYDELIKKLNYSIVLIKEGDFCNSKINLDKKYISPLIAAAHANNIEIVK